MGWVPPGSPAAVERGCTCPRIDNGHGRRTDGRWVFTVGCPVHQPHGTYGTSTAPGDSTEG